MLILTKNSKSEINRNVMLFVLHLLKPRFTIAKHYPTRVYLLQQSRKFVAVGEVVVAIETDACSSVPPPPPHPVSYTLSLSLFQLSTRSCQLPARFTHIQRVCVCSDEVERAGGTTHSSF